MLAELGYKACGKSRYTSGTTPTTYKYTGQREDAGLGGVMFYVARWYDPAVGRFLQADTIVPGAGNPQAFNRYSYVLNSPIKYTDPSGHCVNNDYEQTRDDSYDCTVGELQGLNWDVRVWWLRNLIGQIPDAGDWFNDIIGAIGYLSNDADFSNLNGWASRADAGVLQAVQNGWRITQGQAVIGGPAAKASAQGWANFMEGLADRKMTLDDRIKTRLQAEQGGVDYGWGLAYQRYQAADERLRRKIDLFKIGADFYRAAVPAARTTGYIDEWANEFHLADVFDPRTSWPTLSWWGWWAEPGSWAWYALQVAGEDPR